MRTAPMFETLTPGPRDVLIVIDPQNRPHKQAVSVGIRNAGTNYTWRHSSYLQWWDWS